MVCLRLKSVGSIPRKHMKLMCALFHRGIDTWLQSIQSSGQHEWNWRESAERNWALLQFSPRFSIRVPSDILWWRQIPAVRTSKEFACIEEHLNYGESDVLILLRPSTSRSQWTVYCRITYHAILHRVCSVSTPWLHYIHVSKSSSTCLHLHYFNSPTSDFYWLHPDAITRRKSEACRPTFDGEFVFAPGALVVEALRSQHDRIVRWSITCHGTSKIHGNGLDGNNVGHGCSTSHWDRTLQVLTSYVAGINVVRQWSFARWKGQTRLPVQILDPRIVVWRFIHNVEFIFVVYKSKYVTNTHDGSSIFPTWYRRCPPLASPCQS